MNDCAERGRGLDPEHRPVDGVGLFRSWYASEAYQKHRHDTYAVGVSDSGVQVLDCRGSVRVEDGRHQVCALSILGELVTRFGRVLAVNCTQRAPTRPKEMPSTGELNDRCHWGPVRILFHPRFIGDSARQKSKRRVMASSSTISPVSARFLRSRSVVRARRVAM